MRKNAANLLTALRLLLALFLPFLAGKGKIFAAVFLICGLTDLLDGWLARRINTQSVFGARLDSVADAVMFAGLYGALIYWYGPELKICLPWVAGVFLLRAVHMIAAVIKFHSLAFLHTWSNKLTGLLLFVFPVIYFYTQDVRWAGLPLLFGALAAVEEFFIHLTSDTLDLDRKSLFIKASTNDIKE